MKGGLPEGMRVGGEGPHSGCGMRAGLPEGMGHEGGG